MQTNVRKPLRNDIRIAPLRLPVFIRTLAIGESCEHSQLRMTATPFPACSKQAGASFIGTTLTLSDVCYLSALEVNVLQNYFERGSEEYPFKVTQQCEILIQKSATSDSILARY